MITRKWEQAEKVKKKDEMNEDDKKVEGMELSTIAGKIMGL